MGSRNGDFILTYGNLSKAILDVSNDVQSGFPLEQARIRLQSVSWDTSFPDRVKALEQHFRRVRNDLHMCDCFNVSQTDGKPSDKNTVWCLDMAKENRQVCIRAELPFIRYDRTTTHISRSVFYFVAGEDATFGQLGESWLRILHKILDGRSRSKYPPKYLDIRMFSKFFLIPEGQGFRHVDWAETIKSCKVSSGSHVYLHQVEYFKDCMMPFWLVVIQALRRASYNQGS